MKFSILINSLGGGGAERIATLLANHWSTEHEVELLLIEPGDGTYPIDPRVQVRRLFLGRLSVGPLKVPILPLLALELAVRRAWRRPDAEVSMLIRSNLVNCLSRILSRSALISERNNASQLYPGKSLKHGVMRRLIAWLYPRAGACIAISHGVKLGVAATGLDPDKIRVIHNPIDGELALPKSLTANQVRLVSVGRLIAQKDQQTLLHAFAEVRSAGVDAILTVYGEGGLKQELEESAQQLGLSEYVNWAGFEPNIKQALLQHDIFVFSSRYEGFGNVVLEAMQAGLPVVSTDCHFGPREIISPDSLVADAEGLLRQPDWTAEQFEVCEYGLLAKVGDADGLAAGIKWLVDNPDVYRQLSQRGLDRTRDFEISAVALSYEEVMVPTSTGRR